MAVGRLQKGTPPLEAGLEDEYSNGNGSLMRTLPVGLYFADRAERLLSAAHQVSRITHAHPRSQMCCGLYCLVARRLLRGEAPREAVEAAVREADTFYTGPPWDGEREHLQRVWSLEVLEADRDEIESTGYVVDTLEAALWCFWGAGDFEDALLTAVALGGDADTVGCVTGGLAGVAYGSGEIPRDWVETLVRSADITRLGRRLYEAAAG